MDAGLSCPNRDGTHRHRRVHLLQLPRLGHRRPSPRLSIAAQIEAGKTAMARRYRAAKFIAYFQSFSNTYAPVERLRVIYEEALGVEDVVGLFIGTRPDCVSEPVLDLLQKMAERCLVWVEYGLQTARDATLGRHQSRPRYGLFPEGSGGDPRRAASRSAPT